METRIIEINVIEKKNKNKKKYYREILETVWEKIWKLKGERGQNLTPLLPNEKGKTCKALSYPIDTP